ncbi:MAG: penicillin-binding protein 1A [Alphaproteobacteria bacterium]|nr:penicillin-binding protein 1A [Alphaproteobacteria bacterium]
MSEDNNNNNNREIFRQKLMNRASIQQKSQGQQGQAGQSAENPPPNASDEKFTGKAGRTMSKKLQQKIGIDAKTPLITKIFRLLFATGMVGGVVLFAGLVVFTIQLGRNLPAHEQLQDYQPKISTRVHAGDGKLLAEFAVERRIFVPIAAMPEDIKNAFISAEDKNFYQHNGLDFLGILRAVRTNIQNLIDGRGNLVGASTITQQVAKNFLLSREQTFTRKFKEAIIARRIEKALSKDRILELYLNQIFLGNRSYGVAAAAADYFGKALDELDIAEAALLAALPKAPSTYNPKVNPERARDRRDWVINRMYANGYLNEKERDSTLRKPIALSSNLKSNRVYASYFVEEVRRILIDDIGREKLYGDGLTIRTSLDPTLQAYAEQALFNGVVAYDRRHGYRGALGHLPIENQHVLEFLNDFEAPAGTPREWRLALVTNVEQKNASLVFADSTQGKLDYESLRWARRYLIPRLQEQQQATQTDQELLQDVGVLDERNISRRTRPLGAYIYRMAQVVSVGDVILVSALESTDNKNNAIYQLQQLPEIDGGLVVMDPNTGRVLAMVGGFSFQRSQYNRVTQASRQPGSAFKPFVYLSALEQGFTPATRILDAPFVLTLDNGTKWKPSNYSRRYYGPSPMRLGIEQSRNLMTVRLARTLGMRHVRDVATRFGINDRISLYLPNALGSIQTTLMRLTAAYAMLANGGIKVEPTLIDRLQDRYGTTLEKQDKRECRGCLVEQGWQGNVPLPTLIDSRPRVIDSASGYQIVSMMEGVVARGTGRLVRRAIPGKVIAGKTGTTNNSVDAWFMAFTTDLVVGTYIGFDQPRSLGMYGDTTQEAGSTVAVPIVTDFLKQALQNRSTAPFRVPPNVQLVRINPKTGALSRSGDAYSIVEAFKPGTQPVDYSTASLLIGDNIEVGQQIIGIGNDGGSDSEGGLDDLLNQNPNNEFEDKKQEVRDLDQEAEEDELQGIY